jgi:hypothetical protein
MEFQISAPLAGENRTGSDASGLTQRTGGKRMYKKEIRD